MKEMRGQLKSLKLLHQEEMKAVQSKWSKKLKVTQRGLYAAQKQQMRIKLGHSKTKLKLAEAREVSDDLQDKCKDAQAIAAKNVRRVGHETSRP